MKYPIFFLFLFIFTLSTNAQWTDNGNNITTQDKVGIGATDVSNGLLTINGDTNLNLLRLENDGLGKEATLRFRSKSTSGGMLHSDISLYATGANNQGFLGFKVPHNNTVNGGYDMVINQSGNVGIGTTTPTELLDIAGTGLRIGSNNFNLADQAYINLYEGINHHGIRFHLNGNTNKFSLITRLNQVDEEVIIIPYWGTNAGNVGIGTSNPDAKLAVNGDIHTREVKVDLIGWPDYVFKKQYNLPTLEEVEEHIKQKGHLKDIPTAKEVEENGIYLGEMDSKLLHKIEELTLYTIEQQKEIENLKVENKQLKSLSIRMAKIEKLLKPDN